MFKKVTSKTVYKNRWMEVLEDEIEFPNGKRGIYGYVRRSNGAGVVIINEKNEVLLIRQFRYPVDIDQWGIPGGAIDNLTPKEAAIREVFEETGLKVDVLDELVQLYPLSSGSTEKENIYLARVKDVVINEEDVSEDDEQVVEKRFIPVSKVLEMIDNGEISEAVSANAIQIAIRKLNIF